MPYIITTINPRGSTEQSSDDRSFYAPQSTRTTVTTLDEVRAYVAGLPSSHSVYYTPADSPLTPNGGTINLPNGTVIEVRRITA